MTRFVMSAFCLFLLALSSRGAAAPDARTLPLFGPNPTLAGVIFRYYFPGARQVAVAGDWSGWKPTLVLTPSETREGYFEGLLPLFEQGKYRYKLRVDGLWQHDTENRNRELTLGGDEISWFEIKQTSLHHAENPKQIAPQYWRFYYKNPDAKYVSLVGSFNSYNPYEAVMKRDSSGVWVTEVQVLPGEHSYCFVVDGVWIPDPERRPKGYNRFDQVFSVFTAK